MVSGMTIEEVEATPAGLALRSTLSNGQPSLFSTMVSFAVNRWLPAMLMDVVVFEIVRLGDLVGLCYISFTSLEKKLGQARWQFTTVPDESPEMVPFAVPYAICSPLAVNYD